MVDPWRQPFPQIKPFRNGMAATSSFFAKQALILSASGLAPLGRNFTGSYQEIVRCLDRRNLARRWGRMLAPLFPRTPREVIAHDRPPLSPSKRNSRKIGYSANSRTSGQWRHQLTQRAEHREYCRFHHGVDAERRKIPQWLSPLEQSTSIVGCPVWA